MSLKSSVSAMGQMNVQSIQIGSQLTQLSAALNPMRLSYAVIPQSRLGRFWRTPFGTPVLADVN